MYEDAILPDDFSPEETSQPEEVTEVPEETGEQQTEQVETTTSEPETVEQPKFKVKYNHEEMELGYDEAVPLIQKGMNYDKLQEKVQTFENDPLRQFVSEMAARNGMTPEQYVEAVKEHERQQELESLIQQNVPEEYAREMLESRQFREQWKAEQQKKADEQKRSAETNDFLNYYKQATGKTFDPDADKLPDEVLQAYQSGTPLKQAYMEHEARELRNRIKVLEQNAKNAKTAPVTSVTAHGGNNTTSDPFLEGFDSI